MVTNCQVDTDFYKPCEPVNGRNLSRY